MIIYLSVRAKTLTVFSPKSIIYFVGFVKVVLQASVLRNLAISTLTKGLPALTTGLPMF